MPSSSSSRKARDNAGLKVIVAVDFGTTYSGVAYANTQEPETQTLLRNWGRGAPSSEKAPTVLRYDNGGTTGPFQWGFQAQRQLKLGEKLHEWFKLRLCPEYEERRATESQLSRDYPSKTALNPVSVEDAEKLVVDYLSSLKKRIDENFKDLDARVNELPREYIVTVPAIWDHKEQQRTRDCAQRAGMGKGNRLQIVSEPEAAAIYALQRMSKIGLEVGDTFIICDAGGGTVDLTSYTIRSIKPIRLDGAGKGSGGLCGSSFLNRIFAKYLQSKLRGYTGGWDQGSLNYAVTEFEKRIKGEFTGDDEETYTIMVHGLSNSPRHGIDGGTLVLTGKELRENVFDKVITKIQGLIRDQIANTRKSVKRILLAGGFGQSDYLKQQIEQVPSVKDQRISVQRVDDSNTAIVRGALLAGLSRYGGDDDGLLRVAGPRVESRIAGRSYGTRAYQIFNPLEDDERRKKHQSTGEDLVERMQWFVTEGDSIPDRVPRAFNFEKEREVFSGPIQEVIIHIYSSEKRDADGVAKPKYPDDPGVRECANFCMDLRGLDIPKQIHNGTELYIAKIHIEMTLDSASLSFRGIYGKGTSKERSFEPKLVQFM